MPIKGAGTGGGGGVVKLDDLSDVVISSPTNGDLLNYLSGTWVNTSHPHVGTGSQPSSPASGDLSTFGRIYIGTSISEVDAFITDQNLSVKKDIDISNSAPPTGYTRFLFNLAPVGAVAAGSHSLFKILIAGGTGVTSGTSTINILDIGGSFNVPSGATFNISGLIFAPTLSGTGAFTVIAGNFGAIGSATGGTTTSMVGVQSKMSNSASVASELIAFRATNVAGVTITAAVTQATAYDVGAFASDTDVVTWSGFRISTNPLAAIANKWGLDFTNNTANMGTRVAHKMAIGWNPSTVAAITARLMLAAGVSGVSGAPLKFQTGVSQATPEQGAVEWDGSRLYVTEGTPTRKTIAYIDDIPVATVPSFSRTFMMMGA